MKKLYLCFVLMCSICLSIVAQDRAKYSELIVDAESLYQSKIYLESAKKYNEAFIALGGKGMVTDRYNAACSWSLAGQADSAFVQLFKIAENGNYTNYGHMTADIDLKPLHEDPRWQKVCGLVLQNKEKAEANLEKPLVEKLDSIYQEDQKYRMQIDQIEEKFGRNSKEMSELWKTIQEKDSLNLIKVKEILDTRGWLGPDVVGGQGNSTLFLVIQHADLETQQHYLPMMREAVKDKRARGSELALLEDRVAMRLGKKQIYGSQIGQNQETGEYYVFPLEDPDHVNERRASVGLGPIESYISRWNIKWDVEAYKKQMAE